MGRLLSTGSSHDDKNNDNNHDNNDEGEDGSDDSRSSSSSSSSSFPATIVPIRTPTKVGYGDDAPRMPHVLALPVTNRPLFPGVVTSLTLTEPATIDAIERTQKENVGKNAYISAFLRKKNPTGVSEGGVLLPTPEVITDSSDLYAVGVFAQIHRLTRGVGSGAAPQSDDIGFADNNGGDDGDGGTGGNSSTKSQEGAAASVLLLAHRRVNLMSVDCLGPPIDVTISHWPRLDYTGPMSSPDDTIR